MREMTKHSPDRPAVDLPPEASLEEAADFARGLAILARLAQRVAELAHEAAERDAQ